MKVHGPIRAAATVAAFVALVGCAPRAARRTGPVLHILVSGSFDDSAMLRYATLAREERTSGDLLWLVTGSGIQGDASELVTDGAAAVDRLDGLGVDACLFGPDWLAYGPARASELAGDAGCFILGANTSDTARAAFGQAIMVRRSAIGTIGVCGVWPDSTDPLLVQRGVVFTGADRAAATALPVLRQRADCCLLLSADPADSAAAGWDAAFAPHPDSVRLFEASWAQDNIAIRQVAFGSTLSVPDSAAAVRPRGMSVNERVISGPATDSAVYESRLVFEFIKENRADCLLAGRPLWTAGDVAGEISLERLAGGLTEPTRWALTELNWTELTRFASGHGLKVTTRAGKLPSKTAKGRAWRVLIPTRHIGTLVTELGAGYELTKRPLWTLAEVLLESGSENQ